MDILAGITLLTLIFVFTIGLMVLDDKEAKKEWETKDTRYNSSRRSL